MQRDIMTPDSPPLSVLIVGLGHLGGVILELLARDPRVGRLVAASRDATRGVARVNLARLGALAQGRAPDVTEALTALEKPELDVVVALHGMPSGARPALITNLVRRLAALQEKTGRPHWIVVDEAQHALPARALKDEVALPPASTRAGRPPTCTTAPDSNPEPCTASVSPPVKVAGEIEEMTGGAVAVAAKVTNLPGAALSTRA